MIRTLFIFKVLAVGFTTAREVNKCPENVQTLPTFDSNRVSQYFLMSHPLFCKHSYHISIVSRKLVLSCS